MSEHGKLSCMLLLALSVLPASALAGEGMVMMLSPGCPYMVLDSSDGQILVKKVDGSTPETGDILVGSFNPKEFTRLTNQRTGDKVRVWVNLVDRHGNRAMARRSRYCR